MAPRLSKAQHEQILSMIIRGFPNKDIANIVPCTSRAIRRIRSTHARFGSTTVPPNRTGPDPKITPVMRDALCHRLASDADMVRREMVTFIREAFGEDVSLSSISRALRASEMTWKTMRRVAQQQKPDLRHFYQYKLKMAGCRSYHLVFIDESGIDRSCVFRRKGWAKEGTAPIQKARFQREERVQILASYTQNGIKLSRVFPGSTDAATFEDFIAQLLRHCGKWPEPESVLVMDNAAFHHSDKILNMCDNAGVKCFFTAPYTPTSNPIEEFFGELKTFAKAQHKTQGSLIRRDFPGFVRSCIKTVGSRQSSAEGHFRRAGHYIEQVPGRTEG